MLIIGGRKEKEKGIFLIFVVCRDMAAPPPRLVPAKQPHLPDQRTPEQRYWRSFKVILPAPSDSNKNRRQQ